MDTIREFMVSSSGLAPARRGMALGWVISVLSGVAILLGAKEAKAECTAGTFYINCVYDPTCPVDEPIGCWEVEQKRDCSRTYIDWVCTV